MSDVDLPRDRGAAITVSLRRAALAAAAGGALLLACSPYVQGNGVYHEEERQRAAFAGVRAADGAAAIVTVSPGGAQSLRVIGDSNVVPHVRTEVEPVLVGTTTVPVLHVWVSEEYGSTITPTVVATVPSFLVAEGQDGAALEVSRAEGATFTGAPLRVTLASAALEAGDYPIAGAAVVLSGRGTARLRSSGPVVGTASGDMQLVNLGTGECDVAISGHASVSCD